MRTKMSKILFLIVMAVITLPVLAQGEKVDMADEMRNSGKIYVVIAVILTILAGLIYYVWRLDRKITKLENDSNS